MADRTEHLTEIDALKGLAILWVVGIHAKPFAATWLFDRFTNRAVPIFLVLFGLTSELYFGKLDGERRGFGAVLRTWYVGRFFRLVVPYWAMAAAWWILAEVSGHAPFLKLGPRELTATFIGYAPWIGTSWFVTVILQLVLILPFYRWLAIRAGALPSLVVSGAITSASAYYLWYIVEAGKLIFGEDAPEPGWYYQWIFSPRVLWHVTAGLFVGRLWGGRVGPRATIAFVGITAVGMWLVGFVRGGPEDIFVGSLRQQAVQYLVDVPLALALLGLLRWARLPGLVMRPLAWCGRFSWGIYLGHLLVHESLHMHHVDPERWGDGGRLVYAAFLLAMGVALAAAGHGARRRLRLRAT